MTYLELEQTFLYSQKLYAIRIAKVKGLDLEKTFNVLKCFPYILLVTEMKGEPNEHVQGFVGDTISGISQEIVKEKLLSIYPDMIGNRCHTIKPVRKKNKIISYTIKEDTPYKCQGLTIALINLMKDMSNKKEGLNKKINKLKEHLMAGTIDYQMFKVQYIKILRDHGQNIYVHHVQAYFNHIQLKCKHVSLENFVCDNFDRQRF